VRFPIRPDGSLGGRETVGPESLGRGAFPDGISFDRWGNLWITIVSQNGLMAIDKDGDAHWVYRDSIEPAVEAMAAGVERRNATIEHLMACTSQAGPLTLPTSIAFGGDGGRTAYVGSLTLNHLPTFRLPERLE
jgi:sugar lactone lactonase YvrE